MDTVLDEGRNLVDDYAAAALGGIAAETTANTLSEVVGGTFGRAVATVTGLPETELGAADLPWLMDLAAPLAVSRAGEVDRVYLGHSGVLMDYYNNNPAAGLVINSPFPNIRLGGLPFTFCVVPNPIVKALLMTAEVQLWKIHNCMNIAGMVRELDPSPHPRTAPRAYRRSGRGAHCPSPPAAAFCPALTVTA
ncbi:MAG: hypothetical protein IPF78_04300 [Flavobacteriales bacterium]|nr:hypothetical protein [Flavobacteriales bacterium]